MSEVAIIAGMAAATVGNGVVDWDALADDYDRIRDLILHAFAEFEATAAVSS